MLFKIRIRPKTQLFVDQDLELEVYLDAIETDEFSYFKR
jgi:hypothetical protein